MFSTIKSAAKRLPLIGPLLRGTYLRMSGEGRVRTVEKGWLAGMRYHQYRWSTPQQDLVETNWNDEMAGAFVERIRGKRRFFDVGANWGFYVLLASKHRDGGCEIVAFEPHPQSARELQTQIDLNQIAGARVVQAALSDGGGKVEFADTGSAIGQKLASINGSRHADRTITVPAITLDQATQKYGAPDLIKLDVEGAENLVVSGGEQTLSQHRPILLVEIHGEEKCLDFYNHMDRLGYRCETPQAKPVTDREYHHHLVCTSKL